MWKILVLLCVTAFLANAETRNKRSIPYAYTVVPHEDPDYKAVIKNVLGVLNETTDGIEILSLFKNTEIFSLRYKLTFKRKNGEICFVKWSEAQYYGALVAEKLLCRDPSTYFTESDINPETENPEDKNPESLMSTKKPKRTTTTEQPEDEEDDEDTSDDVAPLDSDEDEEPEEEVTVVTKKPKNKKKGKGKHVRLRGQLNVAVKPVEQS